MRKLLVAIFVVLTSTSALAQSSTQYISIPSSGFEPQSSEGVGGGHSYNGNVTGTARFFDKSIIMFAPLNLPHGATVTSLFCGGMTQTSKNYRIAFTLRRNEPQQANVNMATTQTTFAHPGFQFVGTNSVNEPLVDNATFNYYVVADLQSTDEFPQCPRCAVGFCRIGYSNQ